MDGRLFGRSSVKVSTLERVRRRPLPYPHWQQARTAANLALLAPYLETNA